MAFADIDDLNQYVPTLASDSGNTDWTWALEQAQSDIEKMILADWYQKNKLRYRNSLNIPFHQVNRGWDATKLNESQWTICTVYRAMYVYILPQLSKFSDPADKFQNLIPSFKKRFQDQYALELNTGVQYDEDDDDTIDEDETFAVVKTGLIGNTNDKRYH